MTDRFTITMEDKFLDKNDVVEFPEKSVFRVSRKFWKFWIPIPMFWIRWFGIKLIVKDDPVQNGDKWTYTVGLTDNYRMR